MNTLAAHRRVMRPVPRTTGGAGLAVIASLVLGLAGNPVGAAPRTIRSAAPPPDRRASSPLVLEANRGQADPQVKFVARGAGYTAFLTSTETSSGRRRSPPAPSTRGDARAGAARPRASRASARRRRTP